MKTKTWKWGLRLPAFLGFYITSSTGLSRDRLFLPEAQEMKNVTVSPLFNFTEGRGDCGETRRCYEEEG